MAPEKSKGKIRQTSLLDAPEEKPDSIDRMVASAFDSDPRVRLKAAQELGRIDDPRAIFALIELSSDKDESVKEAASASLSNFKREKEEIVSLEKLLAERKVVQQPAQQASSAPSPLVAQKMVPTIEKLFSHYDPKKRESVMRRLFPSLQRLFGFRREELDPLRDIEKIAHAPTPASQVVELAAKPDEIPAENAKNFPFGQGEERPAPSPKPQQPELADVWQQDAGPVPTGMEDEPEKGAPQQEAIPEEQNRFFSLAYRLATTPGMGKSELKAEKNRMIANFKKEVEIAFKVAYERAREEGFASLDNLKPGMKNLNFAEMPVASIVEIPYGTKKKPYLHIGIWDGKRETPVLVPKERGQGILVSDRIALKKVDVDFLVEKNETVLVVSRKSKVIVVK